jgi:hypothetical protein
MNNEATTGGGGRSIRSLVFRDYKIN